MTTTILLAALLMQQGDSAAFVKKLVAAINTHQAAPRRALRHAKDVCANDEVMRLTMSRQVKYVVPGGFKWRLAPTTPVMAPDPSLMTFRVKPTHMLQLDFQTAQFSSTSVLLNIVHDGSGWHEVFGCATPLMLKQIADATKRRDTRKVDVGRRIREIPRPVRDSILKLDAVGKSVSAVFYYVTAGKSDTTTANEVVDSLVNQHRLTYRWIYPYNTTVKEDHYIVIDTIDGRKRGWYYGVTDDFDAAREGYTPGFYVAPMDKLSFGGGTISFSVTLPPYIFVEPVYRTVRDGRQFAARRWSTVALKGTREYRGAVAGDSIVIGFDRMRRVYKRVN